MKQKIYAFLTSPVRGMTAGVAVVEREGALTRVDSVIAKDVNGVKAALGITDAFSSNYLVARALFAEKFPKGVDLEWVADPTKHKVLRRYCK